MWSTGRLGVCKIAAARSMQKASFWFDKFRIYCSRTSVNRTLWLRSLHVAVSHGFYVVKGRIHPSHFQRAPFNLPTPYIRCIFHLKFQNSEEQIERQRNERIMPYGHFILFRLRMSAVPGLAGIEQLLVAFLLKKVASHAPRTTKHNQVH